ncbi:hypothetical protein, partial [Deinococcus sp.]|uniref:hypothetical protein n=1 Tax=Deinococcus sp. TaxID=47478 RepID=UPI0025C0B1BE
AGVQEATPDPTKDEGWGLMTAAYAQGFAVANTAYAKVGYAVREGIDANKALRDLLGKAGSKRNYIVGVSMGGNITVAMVEKYPQAFAGALPMCGVTPG